MGLFHQLPNFIEVCRQSIDDVADGIKWTLEKGYGDPKRVGVMGGSYGGYISLALATRYPELPAAVVGFAGVYNWERQMEIDSYVQITAFDWRSNYYPSVKAHAAEYRDVSPVYGADKVTAPVLLLHGGNDQRVELEQTGFMERSLRKAGKSVQVVTSLTEIHGLPDQQDRFDFYRTVAAFLLEKMPPDAPH